MWSKGKKRGTVLNCFSPPIMLATFIIEIVLATYTIWRYKLNVAARLAVAMLVTLAVFQLSEYFVCGGIGMSSSGWSRLGYVSITMLPALGLHLLHVIAGKGNRRLVQMGYALAAAFIIFFIGYSEAFTGYQCTGNYVIFQLAKKSGGLYGLYYYILMATAIALGIYWARNFKAQGKKFIGKYRAIVALIVGYLVFIVPTAVANTVKPETRNGIPSIMCGFAVIFAILLAIYIMPIIGERRSSKKLDEKAK